MGIKPRVKWHNYGLRRLANPRFREHYGRLNKPVKKTYGYLQRDETKRATFLAQLGDPKAPHLVYVDESGMDERDNYGYGYAPVGERFYDLKSGRRQGRINMIAGCDRIRSQTSSVLMKMNTAIASV